MQNPSRLKYLAFLCVLGLLAGLWLAARQGDALSIAMLAALATLLLVGLGLAAATLLMYAAARIQQARSKADEATADALRAMAVAMATQGKALGQAPGGGLPMLPAAQAGELPAVPYLPPMTSFKGVDGGQYDEEAV